MVEIADAGEYEKFRIKNYEHFAVFLHPNQYYLGRTYLHIHRDNILDMHDMLPAEEKECFRLGREVKHAVKAAFSPPKFDYASFGNEYKHLHCHIIPRYNFPRTFDGITFVDEQWGGNYAFYNRNFKVPLETLLKIKDSIGRRLQDVRF
jgi:diadenosine tetraphosphate (Ap4A) HIT family hydrolase